MFRIIGSAVIVILLLVLAAGGLLVLGSGDWTDRLTDSGVSTGAPPTGEAAVSAEEEPAALLRQGNLDGAGSGFRRLAENDPDDVDARLALLLIALLTGDMDDARFRADEVSRLRLEGPEAQAAAAAAKLLAGDAAAAQERAGEALETRPDLLLARWVLVQADKELNDPCGALAALQPALDAAEGIYRFQELRLATLAEVGDWDQHHQQMVKMHRLFPDNAQVSEWLFQSEVDRNEPEKAADVLRDIAAMVPNDPAPAIRVASYLRQEQGDAAAEAELERLARIAVSLNVAAALQLERGHSLLQRGQTDAGLEVLRAIGDSVGTSPQVRNDAKIELATQIFSGGDGPAAFALLDEVLSGDRTNLGALKMKGTLLLQQDRAADAVAALLSARDVAPSDTSVLLLLGQAYERNRDPELAQDALARAVELSGNGAEEIEAFAGLLKRHGRESLAASMLARLQTPQDAIAAEPPVQPEASPAVVAGPCSR